MMAGLVMEVAPCTATMCDCKTLPSSRRVDRCLRYPTELVASNLHTVGAFDRRYSAALNFRQSCQISVEICT